jgi:methionyl-tRNA formyltransferase
MTKKVYIATARDIGEKCKIWASENVQPGFELVEDLESADIIVSVLYDKLFKVNIVKEKYCYNFHPGILPNYRGSGICSWAIINEEKYMGVTLHVIDEGIDTGDIIEVRKFPILEKDTAYSLFTQVEKVIYEMFQIWFNKLLTLNFTCVPQEINENDVVYYKKDLRSAKNLTKFIRAFYFPNKEAAYYITSNGEKKYINFFDTKE